MLFILGMGSGIDRSAIDGVVEKTPSNLSRSCKLRKWAKGCTDFDCFSVQILNCLRVMVSTNFRIQREFTYLIN